MGSNGIAAGVPPFVRSGPRAAETPLVVAVPHAGRHYPAAIETLRAVDWASLQALEDRYADRLVRTVAEEGAVAIVATIARAWIDLNRAEIEIGRQSARARAGLGIVPDRVAGQALWRAPLGAVALATRIAEVHRPYHVALAVALEEAHARHGFAVLLDCHSMPALARGGARLVIGDRHGASASGAVARAALRAAAADGLPAAHNAPYAGAFTVERHGRPAAGIHALQLEVDRTLYLDATGREPGPAAGAVARIVARIGWAAVAAARPTMLDIAAE